MSQPDHLHIAFQVFGAKPSSCLHGGLQAGLAGDGMARVPASGPSRAEERKVSGCGCPRPAHPESQVSNLPLHQDPLPGALLV